MKNGKTVTLGLILAVALALNVPFAQATFTVTTTKSTYNPGNTFTYMISGASANALITVVVYGPTGDPAFFAEVSAASDGSAVRSFTIASDWVSGTYTLSVKVDPTGPSAQKVFSITSPGFVSPSDGAVDTSNPYAVAQAVETQTATQAAATVKTMTTTNAARLMAIVTTTKAVQIVEELDDDSASGILNEATSQVTSNILLGVIKAKSVSIINKMTPAKTALAVAQSVQDGKTAEIAGILNDVSDEVAGDILLEVDPAIGVDVVTAMVTGDVNKAAWRVEQAVKRSGNAAKLAAFGGTLQGVSVDTLVSLFREIAGLPATPSTVATVFEVMSIEKVVDVVDAWMVTESYEDLALVFSFLNDEKLEEIYLAMSAEQRNLLYSYLDEATVERVPDLGEFEVSTLRIVPATGEIGDVFTVSVVISNVGTGTSKYTATLKVGGSTVDTMTVTLGPGEDETVSWTVSKATAGIYNVNVNGLTGSFTVTAPPVVVEPAEFEYGAITVLPMIVEEGGEVTVSIRVENVGGMTGTVSVELKIDGVVVDFESVTLAAGASKVVEFTFTASGEGDHTVSVGGKSASVSVEAVPEPSRFSMVYLTLGVIVVAAGYYLYKKRQAEA